MGNWERGSPETPLRSSGRRSAEVESCRILIDSSIVQIFLISSLFFATFHTFLGIFLLITCRYFAFVVVGP